MPKIRLPNWPKLALNPKYDNDVTVCWNDFIVEFFWRCRVPLVKFSYGPNFMSISSLVLKSWQFSISEIYQKSGNLKYSRLNFANIWRLRKVRVTNFYMIASDKKSLNAAKCQGCSFYCFCVIMGKLTRKGGGGRYKIAPPPPHTRTQIRVYERNLMNKCKYLF